MRKSLCTPSPVTPSPTPVDRLSSSAVVRLLFTLFHYHGQVLKRKHFLDIYLNLFLKLLICSEERAERQMEWGGLRLEKRNAWILTILKKGLHPPITIIYLSLFQETGKQKFYKMWLIKKPKGAFFLIKIELYFVFDNNRFVPNFPKCWWLGLSECHNSPSSNSGWLNGKQDTRYFLDDPIINQTLSSCKGFTGLFWAEAKLNVTVAGATLSPDPQWEYRSASSTH